MSSLSSFFAVIKEIAKAMPSADLSALSEEDRAELKRCYEEVRTGIKANLPEGEGEDYEAFIDLTTGVRRFEKMTLSDLLGVFLDRGCLAGLAVVARPGVRTHVPPEMIAGALEHWENLVDGKPGMPILTNLTGRFSVPYGEDVAAEVVAALFELGARLGNVYFDFTCEGAIGIAFRDVDECRYIKWSEYNRRCWRCTKDEDGHYAETGDCSGQGFTHWEAIPAIKARAPSVFKTFTVHEEPWHPRPGLMKGWHSPTMQTVIFE